MKIILQIRFSDYFSEMIAHLRISGVPLEGLRVFCVHKKIPHVFGEVQVNQLMYADLCRHFCLNILILVEVVNLWLCAVKRRKKVEVPKNKCQNIVFSLPS
jgi:hypothetical protein